MKSLLLAYFLLFLLWATPIFSLVPEVTKDNFNTIIVIVEGVTISGVLSLITFLCDLLVSSNLKDKLVGLFCIPKPGQIIFSRISYKTVDDNRFLVSDAITHYSDIIENRPLQKRDKRYYENAMWYAIYSKYKEDVLLCNHKQII